MSSMLRVVITAIAGLAAATSGCGGSPQGDEALLRAKALVASAAGQVWRLAHVTVPNYRECRFEGRDHTPVGFRVRYTYVWEKGDVEHTTQLAFHFSRKGTLSGVDAEDVIEILADSSKTAPFHAADVALIPLRLDVKRRLSKLPAGVDEELKQLADRKLSAKGVAAALLKIREQHGSEE